jgi:cephalosporin hydroxylase
MNDFREEVSRRIVTIASDAGLRTATTTFMRALVAHKYSYNFSWLGRPIIQHPQDIVAMQEIIFKAKPDLIIETGIAHGGGLIFYASMLELLASCGYSNGHVIGIDIDIRPHNRKAIEEHPMFKRISMIEGSSVDPSVINKVHAKAADKKRIMVCLDSNHTHDHVLAELNAYGPLVTKGSYLVVFDTIVEDMPEDAFPDRPWGKGNNPKTAVHEWLPQHPEFEIDKSIENKLLITVAPDGYLKRVS